MKGSGGHLRGRCVWWSRRGHLKVSLRLSTQWFLTWAFQITYRTMYIHISLPLFPECHNNGALCGWNVVSSHRDAICVPGSEAQRGWAWLITQAGTLDELQGSITPRPQCCTQSARLQSWYKHVSQHQLLTASVVWTEKCHSPCNGSCCMHQLGKSLAISFPPRIPRAHGD